MTAAMPAPGLLSRVPPAFYIVPTFFVLNSALNLMNRWALGIYGFRFPLLLTACHAACSFLLMAPGVWALGAAPAYWTTLRRQWRGILAVGCCLAGNVAFNNLSLVYISLSLNQVIRSSIPVATFIVTSALERRVPRKGELFALCVLAVGVALAITEAQVTMVYVAMAVLQATAASSTGVMLCLCGVFCSAFMLATSSRALSERIDVLQLTFLTAPFTAMTLLPPFLLREAPAFAVYVQTQGGAAAAIILAGSALACMYNVVHYSMVGVTGPVTTCVFGQAKMIGLLILSAVLLGEKREFTPRMSLGCGLALLGFGLYSYSKLQQQRAALSVNLARSSPSSGTLNGSSSGGDVNDAKEGELARLLSPTQKRLINVIAESPAPAVNGLQPRSGHVKA